LSRPAADREQMAGRRPALMTRYVASAIATSVTPVPSAPWRPSPTLRGVAELSRFLVIAGARFVAVVSNGKPLRRGSASEQLFCRQAY
jgi:hypothetical protein